MYCNTTIEYLVSLVSDVYSSRDDGGESRVESSHRASDGRGREASSRVESVGRSFGRRDERNVAREKESRRRGW